MSSGLVTDKTIPPAKSTTMRPSPYAGLLIHHILNARRVQKAFSVPSESELMSSKEDPLDSQVGGSHYKSYKIQPIEYAMANNLSYCQANAIKYITRYRDKGGAEDLHKAIHNIQILLKLEYGE